ncbi:MAG: insulinase family protein [Aerococcus sp.]|nr:insulinase family protein [Aerococcus sp.]
MTALQHGFRLIKEEALPDIGAVAYHYHHVRSGGEVVWLKTSDPNRTFGIGFKTPPEDSTGAAHIVEHTVLSGSRKYPVKDPFMQMAKSSMSTFLNAMTFSDMTCFPVSSMNEEDFHHLMDIYLDAVFFPNVLNDERIFQQEGWHKEITRLDEMMHYNGIVYNEMRGEYGDPDRMVTLEIQQKAHPNSTFANESGGFPYEIPALTYENFKAFYHKYYRPDNALVGLYGEIDIDRTLQQIDGDFFSQFEDTKQTVHYQVPAWATGQVQETVYYNGDGQKRADRDSYLSYTLPFSTNASVMDGYRLAILTTALVESEAGPLQEALVNHGHAEDLYMNIGGSYYLDFSFVAEHVDSHQADSLVQLIDQALAEIAKTGIQPELLSAVLNTTELYLRKLGGANRGLTLFTQMLAGWRYRNNPTDSLHYGEIFEQLRRDIEQGAFNQWVQEKLVNPKQRVVLVHEPNNGLFSSWDQETANKLEQEQATLSSDELEALIHANEDLKQYQQTPDSPTALQTLPMLQLTDISRHVTTFLENCSELSGGRRLLYHPQPTNGIRYVTLALSLNHLEAAELPYVSDLAHLLGTLDTAHHSYQALEIAVAGITNGILLQPKIYTPENFETPGEARFLCSFNALTPRANEALSLLSEVLLETKWTDIARIQLVLKQLKTGLEEEMDDAGHRLAMTRVGAALSEDGYYRELLGGLSYYDHVVQLLDQFEADPTAVIQRWQAVLTKILHGSKPVISLTGEATDEADFTRAVASFIQQLPLGMGTTRRLHADTLSLESEAITTHNHVQYVAMGNQILNWQNHGKWRVLGNLMSNEILYEQVRLEGGAYGEGFLITNTGSAVAYSYRDPHLDRTIRSFNQMAESLERSDYNDQALARLIIGTLTSYQFPLPPQQVNGLALNRYFRHTTTGQLLQRLDETLQTSTKDLADYREFLETFRTDPKVVVYGNQDKIKKTDYPFQKVRAFKQS